LAKGLLRALIAPLGFKRFARPSSERTNYLALVFQGFAAHSIRWGRRWRCGARSGGDGSTFHRYEVNLAVDTDQASGAPVAFAELPSLTNLVGKLEHVPC